MAWPFCWLEVNKLTVLPALLVSAILVKLTPNRGNWSFTVLDTRTVTEVEAGVAGGAELTVVEPQPEVNAIPWPEIDPYLVHTLSHRIERGGVARLQSR